MPAKNPEKVVLSLLENFENSFDSQLIDTCEKNGCEQVWVIVANGCTNLIIASQPVSVYDAHMSCFDRILNNVDANSTTIIYGDFNSREL